jgi:hypothetical protein
MRAKQYLTGPFLLRSHGLIRQLTQKGYTFKAETYIPPPNPQPPVVFENNGTAYGITIKGGMFKNEEGATAINVDIDLKPWFEYLLRLHDSGKAIEDAVNEKAESIEKDKTLPTDTRKTMAAQIREMTHQLKEAQGNPDQIKNLIQTWQTSGLPTPP